MEQLGELRGLPRAIRIGFWLCLGLYVLSFFLPADAERTNEKGYSLFVAGIWGLMVALCALLSAIGEGVRLSEVLHIWLAVAPWLANVVFWFALAHYGMGNGRPALRRAVWAALLATVVFLVPGSWYRPAGLPLSPAYWVWLGSMACLALFSALLVRDLLRQSGWQMEQASGLGLLTGLLIATSGQLLASSSVTFAPDLNIGEAAIESHRPVTRQNGGNL